MRVFGLKESKGQNDKLDKETKRKLNSEINQKLIESKRISQTEDQDGSITFKSRQNLRDTTDAKLHRQGHQEAQAQI